MNYSNDKFNLYLERVNLAQNHFYQYRQTKWCIDDHLNTLSEIENQIKKTYNISREDISKECAICMENLHNKLSVSTQCKHDFCYSCIEQNKNRNRSTGHLCPICRTNIF